MELKKTNFIIELYTTQSGQCPFESFVEELDTEAKAKLFANVNILAELGSSARPPTFKENNQGFI